MKYAFFLFSVAFLTTFLVQPPIARWALRRGATDAPDGRKIHSEVVPRAGGLAIFAGVSVTMVVALLASDWIGHVWLTELPNPHFIYLAVAATVAVGVVDDFYPLSAPPKAVALLLIAGGLYASGIQIERLTVPWTGKAIELGWFSLPVTLFWIFLVTNAFNLIDGIDGLAAGLATLALMAFAMMTLLRGQTNQLYYLAPVIGALLAFLPFNFPRHHVFLGDAGSYFVGVILAILSIDANQKGATAFVTFAPLTFVALPVADVFGVVTRRLLAPEAVPWHQRLAGLFRPDQRHIHHLLMRRGLAQSRVTIILLVLSAVISFLGIIATMTTSPQLSILALIVVFVLFFVLTVSGIGATQIGIDPGVIDVDEKPLDTDNEEAH